jgi:DNA-binding MarR family transcriptional regulator
MNQTIETIKEIPYSVTRNGYLKLPEWLIYYLNPKSLIVIREIKRTLKPENPRSYSDITNIQLADRCNMSIGVIKKVLDRLDGKSYIQRWSYPVSATKKRRKIYFRNMRKKMIEKTKGHSFHEVLKTKCFADSQRVEWKRIATDDWLSWIPIPHGIHDGYEMKIYGILIGQHLRGREKINISDRQLSTIAKMDRDKVAQVLLSLEAAAYIDIQVENRRSRTVKFL